MPLITKTERKNYIWFIPLIKPSTFYSVQQKEGAHSPSQQHNQQKEVIKAKQVERQFEFPGKSGHRGFQEVVTLFQNKFQ